MSTRSFTRRNFLERAGVILGGSALVSACGGSSSSSSTTTASSTTSAASSTAPLGTVTGIVWKGYDNPLAFTSLTKDRGLKLQWEYISSSNNEIITKLRAGAEGTIDVVTPGEVFLPAMVEAGLLQPLDVSRIPNLQMLYPEFQDAAFTKIGGQTYGVPISFGGFPINSRPDLVPGLITSYSELTQPQYKGKLVTVDDPQNLYLLLKELLGTPDFSHLTKDQLQSAGNLFMKIRPNLVTIAASFGDVIDIMGRGDAGLCILGYGLVALTLEQRGIKCTNYEPTKSGSITGCDVYAIAAKAPNLAGSYAVLNAVLAPYGNSLMSSYQDAGVTNPDAVKFLPKNQQHLFPYNNLTPYFQANPLWVSPPPTASGNNASQTDVINLWETLKT